MRRLASGFRSPRRVRDFSLAAASLGLFAFSLLTSAAQAQVSSSAFDPNCYQPQLGVPSQIDSIYGSTDQQHLGEYMYGFPPSKDAPVGSVAIIGLPNTAPFLSFVPEGPAFSLHNLNTKLRKSNLPPDTYTYGQFGHFHDTKHMDLLDGRKIFWADDSGNFDAGRFTNLWSSIKGDNGESFNPVSYATFLTSDSVFDIIKFATVDDTPFAINRHAYVLFFSGGSHLFDEGKDAYSDSTFLLQDVVPYKVLLSYLLQGDFRGSGRDDLIMSDDSGNWFFYRNDPPFTMARFANTVYNDTLVSAREIPWKDFDFKYSPINYGLVSTILPHLQGDSSKDFAVPIEFFDSSFTESSYQAVFRGSSSFGSSRLHLTDAEIILRNPWYYDSHQFSNVTLALTLIDCGDMTGIGYKVLLGRSEPPGATYNFFYVTGKAFDDKADMYYSYSTQGSAGSIVPLDADGDKYKDVLISDDAYTTQDDVDKNKSFVGTIHLVHGSNKIPVRLNPKYSVEERKAVDAAAWHITAAPNPCDEKTVLTFDNCTTSRMRMDVASTNGVIVMHDETPAVDGLQQYSADLSSLPAGMYVIRLTCPALGWTGSVNVVKTGAAQEPWNMDLRKLVGR